MNIQIHMILTIRLITYFCNVLRKSKNLMKMSEFLMIIVRNYLNNLMRKCFSGSGTRRYLSDDADPKEKYQMCASFFLMA